MISRSNVAASIIVNCYLPSEDGSKLYEREAEILIEAVSEREIRQLASDIVEMIKQQGIQIIAWEIK